MVAVTAQSPPRHTHTHCGVTAEHMEKVKVGGRDRGSCTENSQYGSSGTNTHASASVVSMKAK